MAGKVFIAFIAQENQPTRKQKQTFQLCSGYILTTNHQQYKTINKRQLYRLTDSQSLPEPNSSQVTHKQ